MVMSRYPTFAYDAAGGGGLGSVSGNDETLNISFDPKALNIPPVTSQSAKVLGLPLPPGLRIGITPLKLEVRGLIKAAGLAVLSVHRRHLRA